MQFERDEEANKLVILGLTFLLFIPCAMLSGILYNTYWEWFAIPIALNYFNYTLPTMSVGAWACISFFLSQILSPTISSSSRSSIEGYSWREWSTRCIEGPLAHFFLGLFMALIMKVVFM